MSGRFDLARALAATASSGNRNNNRGSKREAEPGPFDHLINRKAARTRRDPEPQRLQQLATTKRIQQEATTKKIQQLQSPPKPVVVDEANALQNLPVDQLLDFLNVVGTGVIDCHAKGKIPAINPVAAAAMTPPRTHIAPRPSLPQIPLVTPKPPPATDASEGFPTKEELQAIIAALEVKKAGQQSAATSPEALVKKLLATGIVPAGPSLDIAAQVAAVSPTEIVRQLLSEVAAAPEVPTTPQDTPEVKLLKDVVVRQQEELDKLRVLLKQSEDQVVRLKEAHKRETLKQQQEHDRVKHLLKLQIQHNRGQEQQERKQKQQKFQQPQVQEKAEPPPSLPRQSSPTPSPPRRSSPNPSLPRQSSPTHEKTPSLAEQLRRNNRFNGGSARGQPRRASTECPSRDEAKQPSMSPGRVKAKQSSKSPSRDEAKQLSKSPSANVVEQPSCKSPSREEAKQSSKSPNDSVPAQPSKLPPSNKPVERLLACPNMSVVGQLRKSTSGNSVGGQAKRSSKVKPANFMEFMRRKYHKNHAGTNLASSSRGKISSERPTEQPTKDSSTTSSEEQVDTKGSEHPTKDNNVPPASDKPQEPVFCDTDAVGDLGAEDFGQTDSEEASHNADEAVKGKDKMDSEEAAQTVEEEAKGNGQGWSRPPGRTPVFVKKLHEALEYLEAEGQSDIASFLKDGKVFCILKPEKFSEDVLPRFFSMTSYASFQRQLNLYDFIRITEGPYSGAYHHKLFIKGDVATGMLMKRNKNKGMATQKMKQHPHQEADAAIKPTSPTTLAQELEDGEII